MIAIIAIDGNEDNVEEYDFEVFECNELSLKDIKCPQNDNFKEV